PLNITITHQPAGDDATLTTERLSPRASAFDLVASTPWAITPDMLETISAIARRENDPIEAVEARLGRPLQNTRAVTMRGNTAVIPITGPIFRYANLFTQISGATSLEVLAQDFTSALDNPQVENIVLNIDSPGGQATGISDFAAMVRASSKPVTAFIDGQAASAAYWIAAAAGDVVISKTAIAGNVGAVLSASVSRDQNRVEIVSSQSPNKRPDITTDQGRAQIQAVIDDLAQVFIDDVAAYRGMTAEAVIKDWNGGDVFTGEKAVALNLADRVGTFEEVIAGLSGKPQAKTASPIYSQGEHTMDIQALRAEHPELCAALVEEGRAAGFEAGAAAERQRIQDVEAQSLPGHEALIAQLKFDGKTTGPEAAVQVLAAERSANQSQLAAIREERIKPVPAAVAQEGAQDDGADLSPEDRARAEWDKDASIRAEFAKFETYLAWHKAHAAGQVKTLGKKG
ncbi:MAG: hypothetical protein RL328_2707, partial [Acidobacteriota bacterium]